MISIYVFENGNDAQATEHFDGFDGFKRYWFENWRVCHMVIIHVGNSSLVFGSKLNSEKLYLI